MCLVHSLLLSSSISHIQTFHEFATALLIILNGKVKNPGGGIFFLSRIFAFHQGTIEAGDLIRWTGLVVRFGWWLSFEDPKSKARINLMGQIFCMTLLIKRPFNPSQPQWMHLSGPCELDHIHTVCSILLGENLP